MVEHFLHRAHRHHHQPDQEVGESQRRDEVVGGRVQVPLPDHGDDHQTVSEHGHHAEHHQHRRQWKSVTESRPTSHRLLRARHVVVFVGRAVCQRCHCRPVHDRVSLSVSRNVTLRQIVMWPFDIIYLSLSLRLVTETHNAIFWFLKSFVDRV